MARRKIELKSAIKQETLKAICEKRAALVRIEEACKAQEAELKKLTNEVMREIKEGHPVEAGNLIPGIATEETGIHPKWLGEFMKLASAVGRDAEAEAQRVRDNTKPSTREVLVVQVNPAVIAA